jgi:predicted lactoylglutathione lyase
MFDHISTYAKDYVATVKFYKAAFAPLGYTVQTEFVAEWDTDFPTRRCCAFGENDRKSFWVIETKETITPRHIAFTAESRSEVDAFYTGGMASGGEDNGAPGLRPTYHEHYYGAFVLDPDGNNTEAVCHLAEG